MADQCETARLLSLDLIAFDFMSRALATRFGKGHCDSEIQSEVHAVSDDSERCIEALFSKSVKIKALSVYVCSLVCC